MAMHHIDKNGINAELWMSAEDNLVEAVARALCRRHGTEIFGYEAVNEEFLNHRWRCFEMEARDATAIIREYDAKKIADELEQLRADKAAISDTASFYLHEITRLKAGNHEDS